MRCEPTRRSFMAAIGAAAAGAARPPITLARDEPSAPAYRTAGELVEALAGKEGAATVFHPNRFGLPLGIDEIDYDGKSGQFSRSMRRNTVVYRQSFFHPRDFLQFVASIEILRYFLRRELIGMRPMPTLAVAKDLVLGRLFTFSAEMT